MAGRWEDGPGFWSKLTAREAQLVALHRRGTYTCRQMADIFSICTSGNGTHSSGNHEYADGLVVAYRDKCRAKGVRFMRENGYWKLHPDMTDLAYAFSPVDTTPDMD